MQKNLGIAVGVVGFLILVLLLNYFNILPLSKNYSQFFGFLPTFPTKTPPTQQPQQSSTQTQTTVSESEVKVVCKRFTDLKEAVNNIDIACVLDLSNQKLKVLSGDITKLSKLSELSLKVNNLSQFPTQILSITTLLSLDLSDNQISQVPENLNKLTSLQILDLSNNKISSLPKELPQTVHTLKLTGNPIGNEEQKRIKELFPSAEISF